MSGPRRGLVALIRTPVSSGHPLNKLGSDAVSLNRERVIGIGPVIFLNSLHVLIDIYGDAGLRWEAGDYVFPH
jgi:hypothetical protein